MTDLSTSYMGLTLRNPVIVGSSGLTRTVDQLIKAEEKGAGAVVLKSLFEEQIKFEIRKVFSYDDVQSAYTEADDYIRNYSRAQTIDEYLKVIKNAKEKLSIPVIASINCVSADEWPAFAKEIEKAGADALELNVFVLPSDIDMPGSEYEKLYFHVIENVKKQVQIPISLKISYHFSGLAEVVKKISWSGVQGIVLFNRFFNPDFDLEKFIVKPGNLYSTPDEISTSLRWIAILSGRVQTDLCASTGVHDGYGVVKQLLAGAHAVQICSTLYKHGFDQISLIIDQLQSWMEKNNFSKIEDFRGKMSFKKSENPAVFQRVQFMKHFAGID
ncbi:MAG: dihydroorotate dehydrogenase-like protein [Bacteroidales bacterium]|nr:dihydroorotate dehydrogenase-like protein [Bacteroidales bacterium]